MSRFKIVLIVVACGLLALGALYDCTHEEKQKASSVTIGIEKPVVYLYPESEMDVTVSMEHPERLTCTYPETDDGTWSVVAEPDGTLTDEATGRSLYALYYEARPPVAWRIRRRGVGRNRASVGSSVAKIPSWFPALISPALRFGSEEADRSHSLRRSNSDCAGIVDLLG